MKKLILMMLLVVGGVMTASAADDMYLRCNLNANEGNGWLSWNNDLDTYKFTYVGNNGTEDIYTYVIDASNWIGDINFRLHKATWGGTQQIPKYGNECIWNFSDYNQATYEIWANGYEYKSDNYPDKYFTIDHASVGASEYKITLYWRTSDNRIWMTVDVVSMPAKVSSLGYSTFSCDRALDLSGDDIYAYKAMEELISNYGYVVKLTRVRDKVSAGTGLLLKGTVGQTTNLTLPVATSGEINNELTDLTKNRLKATVTAQDVTPQSGTSNYCYFLSYTDAYGIGFYSLENGKTYQSGAGKAYLVTASPLKDETQSSSGSRAAWIFEDDTTTGISAIKNEKQSNEVYNLNGQRVNNAVRGLYIVNGKKVIMK